MLVLACDSVGDGRGGRCGVVVVLMLVLGMVMVFFC